MPVSLHHIVIDAHDLRGLAEFLAGSSIGGFSEREHEIVMPTDVDTPVGICFMPASDGARKVAKNRVHLDLSPGAAATTEERLAEFDRLLADPEGNEFCVLRPKRTLIA